VGRREAVPHLTSIASSAKSSLIPSYYRRTAEEECEAAANIADESAKAGRDEEDGGAPPASETLIQRDAPKLSGDNFVAEGRSLNGYAPLFRAIPAVNFLAGDNFE